MEIIGVIKAIKENKYTIDEKDYIINQPKKLREKGLGGNDFSLGMKVKVEPHATDDGKFSITEILSIEPENKKRVSESNVEEKKERPILSDKPKFKVNNDNIFSYPYNFISLEEGVARTPYSKGNLSGIITCSIENLTPIFIGGKKHKNEKHIQESFAVNENNQFIIPASSLKGCFRSVFEAITNSCYTQINNERLEERSNAGGFNFKYGTIIEAPSGDKKGKIKELISIKIDKKVVSNFNEGIHPIKIHKGVLNGDNNNLSIIGNDIIVVKGKESYNSEELINGYLWKSSNIYNKKYETLLYDSDDLDVYTLITKEFDDFNYIIKQRSEREIKNGKEFYYKKIEESSIVMFDSDEDNNAINLAFSQIPRLRTKKSPYDCIPGEFTSCNKIDELCYTCRVFGMTGNTNEKKQCNEEKDALAGRVFFSDAVNTEPILPSGDIYKTIKPLGTPHPTLVNFYLESEDYNTTGLIRGRKFYWHHKDKIGKKFEDIKKIITDMQKTPSNSSLQLLDTGNIFNFQLAFKDLKEDELGLLLYTLKLENGLLHKIGRGKSLGLGSSKVKILNCCINDINKKYTGWVPKFTKDFSQDEINKIIENAVNNLKIKSSNRYKELSRILSKDNNLDFKNCAYPEDNGKLSGRNSVNWFMNKKNKGKYPSSFKLPHILDYIKKDKK